MIKEQLLQHMRDGIRAVINGETDSYKSELLSLYNFQLFLEDEYNVVVFENFDTNGWEVDFWSTFTINNKKYQLTGSMFYGNITFKEYHYD